MSDVAFLSPCGDNIDSDVFRNALAMVSAATAAGNRVVEVGITKRTLVHTARSWLAAGFLETNCEWSFWFDDDMILEPRTINVMLEWAKKLNAKMLTGVYFQRLGSHKPLVLRRDSIKFEDGEELHTYEEGDDYTHHYVIHNEGMTRPYQVHCAGFGCMLIHRSVFETVAKPWFRPVFFSVNGGEEKEASEDFYFCVKARKAGFELWAVPELICGHLGNRNVITRKDFVPDQKDLVAVKLETIGEWK